jgi:uncharacterized DUF497 family protein
MKKRVDKNLLERGKGFEQAAILFQGPFLTLKVNSEGEKRIVVFGYIDGKEWMAVFTEGRIPNRVISLRRASKREREKYYVKS